MDQAAMEAFARYATPGPEHALLSHKLGRWRVAVRFYFGGQKVAEDTGESVYGWILGGRVLENRVRNLPGGRPFEGLGYSGFDNARRHYWFVWFDQMGTGYMRGEGSRAGDGTGIDYRIEATDARAGAIKRARGVERFLAPDRWISQSFEMTGETEELRSEFTYERA